MDAVDSGLSIMLSEDLRVSTTVFVQETGCFVALCRARLSKYRFFRPQLGLDFLGRGVVGCSVDAPTFGSTMASMVYLLSPALLSELLGTSFGRRVGCGR